MKLISVVFYPEPRLIFVEITKVEGRGKRKRSFQIWLCFYKDIDKTLKIETNFFEILFCCYKLICIFVILIGLCLLGVFY